MSTAPPPLPSAVARPRANGAPAFLAPVAKTVLVVCIVSAVTWGAAALCVVLLRHSAWLQNLLQDHDLFWVPPSLLWLGHHAVAVNLGMFALSVLGAAACRGILRHQRWALWTFIVLLVVTALLNFYLPWAVEELFRHLHQHVLPNIGSADTPQLRQDLLTARVSYTAITGLTAVAFAVVHAWLVVRLLRPDVQRLFRR